MALRPADLKLPFSSLVELLEARARQYPDGIAYSFLKDGGVPLSITYEGLERQARAIAARLARTVMSGDRVLLLYPPGLGFAAAFFGSMYAGVVPAPLPVAGTRGGLEKITLVGKDTGARIALTVSALADDLRGGLPGVAVEATDAIDEEGGDGFPVPAPEPGSLAYLQYTSGSTSTPRGVMVSHANVLHNLANIDHGFQHSPGSVIVSWLGGC